MPRGYKGFNQRDFNKISKKSPLLAGICAGIIFIFQGIVLCYFGADDFGVAFIILGALAIIIGALVQANNRPDEKTDNINVLDTDTPLVNLERIKEKTDIPQDFDFDFLTENIIIDNTFKENIIRFAQLSISSLIDNYGDERLYYESGKFNKSTRIFELKIRDEKYYKTVERYVQRNYERYPIYSETKKKIKYIEKKIKLTNATLESLNDHNDDIISSSASHIIIDVNDVEFVPYWFMLIWLGKFYTSKIDISNNKIKSLNSQYLVDSTAIQNSLLKCQNELNDAEAFKNNLVLKISKISRKLQRKTVFFKKHKLKEQSKLNDMFSKCEQNITALSSAIDKLTENAQKCIEYKDNSIKEINDYKDASYKIYYKLLKKLPHLETTLDTTSDFKPLKNISSLEYTKIVGCYIIRNTENGKCYVGQSKDVMRRIKQHFKGTVPNNPIFAEDYYTSKNPNKEDLFEIKVIELQTKDELDQTEKELIEEYDAYRTGYNGTQGNT